MSRQHFKISKGISLTPTTSQPVDPENGDVIYNSTSNQFEGYESGVWGTFGSGGSGVVNLITNGNADKATSNIFIPYSDRVGTPSLDKRPTDGTAGSPNVTTALDSVSPINGVKSYQLIKDAADRQGQGWSTPAFTVDPVNRAKSLKISVDYQVVSGTFVPGTSSTDGDVIWYIFDITNSQLIEPSNIKMFSNTTTLTASYEATFQTSATGASYRLIAHVATVSALAYTLEIDNVTVSPQVYVYGSPVTDWQSYTPTITGAGTPASVLFFWRQVGDSIDIMGEFSTGTATAANATFTMPAGLTIATNKTGSGFGVIYGTGARTTATGSTRKRSLLLANNVTGNQLYFVNDDYTTAQNPNAAIAGNAYWGSGEFQSVMVTNLPILGWSSSVQMSNSADTRVVDFAGRGTAGTQALTGGVTNITFDVDKDSHGAWTGSTYVVRVPGDYNLSAFTYSSTAFSLQSYVNAVANKWVNHSVANSGGNGNIILHDLKTDDIISVRSNTTATLAADTKQSLSISRIAGPQAIAASDSINAKYSNVAGTSVGTGSQTLTFPTRLWDSNGSFSANTTFTASSVGKYAVNLKFSANTIAGLSTCLLRILVNGVTVSEKGYAQSYSTASPYTWDLNDDISLLAGDTVTFQFQNGFGSAITSTTTVGHNSVAIKRVGN